MEEVQHILGVLTRAKSALEEQDAAKLKELSDTTIHAASVYQHTDAILIAVITYALSKMLEQKDTLLMKHWYAFVRDISRSLALAIQALRKERHKLFIFFLQKIKKELQTYSPDLQPLIQEVLRKASINKASKIYEHGISLAKTTKLLGITPWELTEYVGEKENPHLQLNKTIDIRTRARMALEFFT